MNMYAKYVFLVLFSLALWLTQVVGCHPSCTCDETTVVCTNAGPISVSTDIPKETESLTLVGNTSLVNGTFSNFTSLTSLKLDNTTMLVDGDTFTGLLSLVKLVIVNNNNNGLFLSEYNVFVDLISLEELTLGNCGLTTISNGTFSGLINLRMLDLCDNQLTQFPKGSLDGLQSLKSLKVSSNLFTEMPSSELFVSTPLKSLFLDGNPILSLENGQFYNFSHLEDLSLKNVVAVKNLTDHIFDGIADTLRSLDLSSNELSSTPSSVRMLRQLKRLDIQSNKIVQLDVDVYSELRGLNILNLNENQLENIPGDILSNFDNLTQLYLGYNNITHIPKDGFGSGSKLQRLYLNNNNMETIDANAFRGFSDLTFIDLTFNALSSLPDNVFADAPNDAIVNLDHNPWHCDCNLFWLAEWYTNHIYDSYPKCQTPSELIDVNLNKLTEKIVCAAPKVRNDTNTTITATVGTNQTIKCESDGTPAPLVVWHTPNGSVISPEMISTGAIDGKYSMVSLSLIVHAVAVTDAGNYTCFVWNILGNSSRTVSLVVTPPTMRPMTSRPQLTSVIPAQSTISRVTMVTNPPSPTANHTTAGVEPKVRHMERTGLSDTEVGMIAFAACFIVTVGAASFAHWFCKKRDADYDEEEETIAFENRMFASFEESDVELV
ncbi:uncharacterized protein LOC102801696 [Saccoglossus kowalevskii]|uniref:Leucine-rich repeat and fibronectin type-III domain-containing protein 5-like n=1 Tax=Saccoglossus kowalevskii TaxID=10224 RepID=A0ABM0MW44_SACKO|nr:PREDICTED: leucine-rich repeat and fibronectin type-III domain-containing protein 5-like [Saccoglossus kowalevskii]